MECSKTRNGCILENHKDQELQREIPASKSLRVYRHRKKALGYDIYSRADLDSDEIKWYM